MIVLSWWSDEIANQAERRVFSFMDGPFEIRTVRDGDEVRLTGVWRRQIGDKIIFSELVSEDELSKAIQTVTTTLLTRLKNFIPDSPDFKRLVIKALYQNGQTYDFLNNKQQLAPCA